MQSIVSNLIQLRYCYSVQRLQHVLDEKKIEVWRPPNHGTGICIVFEEVSCSYRSVIIDLCIIAANDITRSLLPLAHYTEECIF